jgi:hypothetical protein
MNKYTSVLVLLLFLKSCQKVLQTTARLVQAGLLFNAILLPLGQL